MSEALSASPPYFACGSCRSLPLTTLIWLPVGCVYDLLLTMMGRRILASLRPGNCGRKLCFAVRGLELRSGWMLSLFYDRSARTTRLPLAYVEIDELVRARLQRWGFAGDKVSARHCIVGMHACFHNFGLIAILVDQPG